ncbi:MAG: ParA family protein [Alphaproteobacteria bacterium]|nr:ParA family protein [Alphaproteobacteria bacterium]
MRVIVVTSQKGGSGKTTLSGHLAFQAEATGHGPVALIDTDPQGSLAAWWNARAAHAPLFIQTDIGRLFNDLEELRSQEIRLVVIDTPPAVTGTIRSVVAHADLVVIPARPSPHDLRAVGATLDIVEGRHKPLVFVINGATPKAKITSDAVVALSQHGTVAPVMLRHRTDFSSAMIDGRTVMECSPASRSAVEMTELWAYLAQRLQRVQPRPAALIPGLDRPVFGRHHADIPTAVPVAADEAPHHGFGRRAVNPT